MDSERHEIRIGDLAIVPAEHRARFGAAELPLTAREFDILMRLAERPGWVVSADQLADDGYLGGASPCAVNVHISHIRSKLTAAGAPAEIIETVRGVGWRFTKQTPPALSSLEEAQGLGRTLARAREAAADMRFDESAALLGTALEQLGRADIEPSRAMRVRSLILERRGAARSACAESSLACSDYERALAVRPQEDHRARARLHTRLAYVAVLERNRGITESALRQALTELELVSEHDRAWWESLIEVRLQAAQAECIADLPLWDEAVSTDLAAAVEAWGTDAQKTRYQLTLADIDYHAARYVVTPEVVTHARLAVDYSLRTTSVFLQSMAIGMLGSFLVHAGELREAEVRLKQAIDLSRRCGDRQGVQAATMFLSLAGRLAGDVRLAARHAQELLSMAAEHPTEPEFECTALGQLAWVALRRDDLGRARDLSEQAVALWEREHSMSQSVWVMAWPAVACALAEDDLERAVEFATLMTRPDQQVLINELDSRLAEAVVLHRRDDIEAAGSLMRGLAAEARSCNYV